MAKKKICNELVEKDICEDAHKTAYGKLRVLSKVTLTHEAIFDITINLFLKKETIR